jgi:hypothetical protein
MQAYVRHKKRSKKIGIPLFFYSVNLPQSQEKQETTLHGGNLVQTKPVYRGVTLDLPVSAC